MARRLIVDTGVLVASERGSPALSDVVGHDDDLVVAAVTVAELRTGVELASDRHRKARTEFVQAVLRAMPVEPYDLVVAEAHGRLLAHVHGSGVPRGAHDLIIAATAVATGRAVLTYDRRAHFDHLPGVESVVVPSGGRP